MSAAELLELVETRGVKVWPEGDRLAVEPASKLPPDLLATLREHRDEILDHLRRERPLPTDPVGACAWCGGDLGDRRRLCRACTEPDVGPRSSTRRSFERRGTGAATAPALTGTPEHRRCSSCGGGLQPSDSDFALCQTCAWTLERLAPRRVQ